MTDVPFATIRKLAATMLEKDLVSIIADYNNRTIDEDVKVREEPDYSNPYAPCWTDWRVFSLAQSVLENAIHKLKQDTLEERIAALEARERLTGQED
jgi:hypothetical protein